MSNIDLRLGNVLDVLAQMPSESVHCIVTSPPYWGLRAYGTEPQVWRNGSEPCSDGHEWVTETSEKALLMGCQERAQREKGSNSKLTTKPRTLVMTADTCTRCGAWRGELGLEPTPELFVEHIVAVMREARRVLRADGTMWLNIGDSYNGSGGYSGDHTPSAMAGSKQTTNKGSHKKIQSNAPTLKPKDLVGIPWRVAFALQQDGWYLRSDIIWHKPNPMPESVRDRPTKAHEYLFLLAKQPRYYYDSDAIREPHTTKNLDYEMHKMSKRKGINKDTHCRVDPNYSAEDGTNGLYNPAGRNRRSVWTVTTKPFSGAHFATFPPKLIEPCILAATSERGVCSKCGAPWVRIIEREETSAHTDTDAKRTKKMDGIRISGGGKRACPEPGQPGAFYTGKTTGWRASCACDAGEPVPATVLDPFNGAGTTGLVALQHGRNYIGIDLKQEYLDMTRARLEKAQLIMVTA